jgi:hypothetical protein
MPRRARSPPRGDVPARRGPQRPHVGHDRARPRTPRLALDLPGHGDSSWREDAAYTVPPSPPTSRPRSPRGPTAAGARRAVARRPHRGGPRHAHPELVRELVVVDITPGIDPNGDAAIAAFFAGRPTGRAATSSSTARSPSDSAARARRRRAASSSTRACARTDASSGSTTSRTSRTASPPTRPQPRAPGPAAGAPRRLSATGWDDLAAAAPITLVRGERGFVTETDAEEFRRRLPRPRSSSSLGPQRPGRAARAARRPHRGPRAGLSGAGPGETAAPSDEARRDATRPDGAARVESIRRAYDAPCPHPGSAGVHPGLGCPTHRVHGRARTQRLARARPAKGTPKCSAAPPSPRPLCSRPAPCCSAPAPAAPPSPSATGTPDPDATVAVRLVSEPSNLDIRETAGAALDQILIDNVYQGLVSRTPDQEIVDTLASSHEISADGLTYTFTLREGVTFHDGQPSPRRTSSGRCSRSRTPRPTATRTARERDVDRRERSGHRPDALRARFDPPVEPHRPRGPRPQGRRHDRPQDEGERHRPLRPHRLEAGRLDHAEAQ